MRRLKKIFHDRAAGLHGFLPVLVLLGTGLFIIGSFSTGRAATAPTYRADRFLPSSKPVDESWRAAMAKPDPLLEGLAEEEILRLGEQMYRNGILPDGEVMEGYIRGDIEVDSTAFSCSSCHLRAGLGSFEGGVVTPPTTGRKLYQSYRRPPSLNDVEDMRGRYIYAKTILERPPYTRENLKDALRYGKDPVGEVFNDVMPRYPLSDRNMAILVRYLELLSLDDSPGVLPDHFNFATIIADDVSAVDRKALLDPLNSFIANQNRQVDIFKNFLKMGFKPTAEMQFVFRTVDLAVWELKGPPETWGEQLAAYYEKNPVFAVLGGISNQDWRPIHEFCEARRLPCLYPITELPVVSENDWYTLYFNKGYYQEGEATARFLHRDNEDEGETSVLQVLTDTPAGHALAAGFNAGRNDMGQSPAETLIITADQVNNREILAELISARNPRELLLWTDPAILPALPDIVASIGSESRIFFSSSLLGSHAATIADEIRDQVFLTFPYRLKPYVGDEEGTGFLSRDPILTTYEKLGDKRISTRTGTMLYQAVIQGITLLYNNRYRDYLLDTMSMQMDRVVFDYERLSFGPGQRYASKGCYIIQLGPGEEPELLPRSEWVIH